MTQQALIAITMARKPIAEGSVVANVLRYGTGAINIEATRIAATDGYQKMWDRPVRTNITSGTYVMGPQVRTDLSAYRPSGRWPANLVVQHTPSCRMVGTRESSFGGGAKASGGFVQGYEHGSGFVGRTVEVPVWDCAPSCAVCDIDAQDPDNSPGSQFFLNLSSDGSNALPDDLVAYLRRMVTVEGGSCVVLRDLDESDMSNFPSDHHHAAIVRGEPTPEQAADLLRTLRPGGHLFVAAPEHRPTGHVGACRVEDAGFDVRDCILWVRDAGHVHYVPKTATAEREAGLAHLPERAFAPSGGAQNALAAAEENGGDPEYGGDGDLGFNRITKRRNSHPTVKPKALMARLLRTVPADRGPVLDPFMGSGTTMIACLETGHDGVGIEREAEYMEIADARVRHWNTAVAAWDAATIVSDHVSADGAVPETTLEDLLGL